MQAIFDQLKRTNKRGLILLDTCFLIDLFHNHKEKELLEQAMQRPLAITSFNAQELAHVLKKVDDKSIITRIRKFFKEHDEIKILDIPVSPGSKEKELAYVNKVDPYLAQDVPDPSDAVLIAAAIQTGSIVMTKDKHHLFTVLLENYLERWNLRVLKSFHELSDV